MLAESSEATDQLRPADMAAALGASFNKTTIWLTVALTMMAFALRFYHLSSQSLWQDEVYSVYTATVPLGEVYSHSTKLSNSLPTYFLLLWMFLPDRHDNIEWAARFLSALAGALSVPVFAGIVFYWRRNIGAALLAGVLLAVNPLHLWYSQEARAYALVLFFGLLAILFLELAFASNREEWLTLYFFASIAAVAMHRSAVVFPGLCFVWHVARLRQQQDAPAARFRQLLFHVPIGVVALLLMFIKLNPPPEGYRHGGSILQFGYTFMTFLGGYSFGPSLGEIQNLGATGAVARAWFQIALLVLVLAPLVWVCAASWQALIWSRETALLGAGAGLAAYAMISGFAYNVRYVLPGLLGFLALIATLVVTVPARAQLVRVLTAAVIVVALWADAQWFYNPRYRKPDARGVSKWLVANKASVKAWTILPDYLRFPLNWYLTDTGQDVIKQWLPPSGPMTISFPPAPDVLMLQRRDQLREADKIIDAYRAAVGNLSTNLSFAGFEIYLRDRKVSTAAR